jgi:diaminohydroxyphosphoribosylaminopyrimidine deaminase/5-amino-6-(5-phosphoribosylamino)uracil reductase
VQHWRAISDAIITGSGTLMVDNPSLNVRLEQLAKPLPEAWQSQFRQPLRVLIDRRAKASLQRRFFQIPSPIWWVGESEVVEPLPDHIERKIIPGKGAPMLRQLLQLCASNECNQVLIEAGSRLAGEFLKAGLIDEMVVYMAPKLMGSEGRPLASLPLTSMEQAIDLELVDSRMVGRDLRLIYRPVAPFEPAHE